MQLSWSIEDLASTTFTVAVRTVHGPAANLDHRLKVGKSREKFTRTAVPRHAKSKMKVSEGPRNSQIEFPISFYKIDR